MRAPFRSIAEQALCVAVLAAAAAAPLAGVLLRGEAPIDTRAIFSLPPWHEAAPEGLDPDAAQEAPALQFYPWYRFLNDSVRSGDLPLWSPLENTGAPFFAAWRTRCISPFSIPFYLAELPAALISSVFLKLLVAGIAAFYMARRMGFRPPLSLFVALSWQWCAGLLLWWNWPLSDVLPWFPLLLLFAERVAMGQRDFWPAGAVVVALMLAGGGIEAAASALLFVAGALALRGLLARAPREVLANLAGFLGAAALGVAIVAVQVLPFAEFVLHAASTGRALPPDLPGGSAIGQLFLPRLATGPTAADFPSAALLYLGIVPLALLPLGVAVRRYAPVPQRQRVDALLGMAVLFTALGLLLAGLFRGRLEALPLHPAYLLLWNALVIPLVAAAAAEEWLEVDAEAVTATLKRLLAAAPAGLAIAVACVWLTWSRLEVAPPVGQILVRVAVLVIVLALLATTLFKPSCRLLGYGLAAAVAIDLAFAWYGTVPRTERADVFPETAVIETLHADDGRVGGTLGLREWPLAGNGIAQLYGAGGLQTARHRAFVRALERDPLLLRRTGSAALLLQRPDVQGPFAELRSVLRVHKVFPSGAVLFEDLAIRPRVWMTYEGRPVDSFDPEQLSSELPPLFERMTGLEESPATPPSLDLVRPAGNTRLTVDVATDARGVVVVADAWYPGWVATVDGEAAPLFPVDGLFRGIEVPEGEHTIELSYRPRPLIWGLGISAAALLIALAGAVRLAFRHRRRAAGR